MSELVRVTAGEYFYMRGLHTKDDFGIDLVGGLPGAGGLFPLLALQDVLPPVDGDRPARRGGRARWRCGQPAQRNPNSARPDPSAANWIGTMHPAGHTTR